MAIYVKPLTMADPDGYQSTAKDNVYTFNLDDPAAFTLTVDAEAATALPVLPASTIYMIASTEEAVVFLKFSSAANQLATAADVPLLPNRGDLPCRIGSGVTHIHAGSGS